MFFIGSAGSRCERRGPVPNQPCPGCGRRGMELIETYFGLSAFFLPLARLDRRYYLVCPGCAGVWEISRADGKLLQQQPEAVLPADHLAAAGGFNPRESRFCPNCGAEVSFGDRFCRRCGHPL